MDYEIDWQATYDAIMDLPPSIFFLSIIFDELATEATKHDIVELFDDNCQFYLTDDGRCDIM